jgi:hypothetical protein
MNLINKIGFFRLTLIPLGVAIIVSAYNNGIIGMGLVGVVVLIFGILNRCLLLGQCEVEDKASDKKMKM